MPRHHNPPSCSRSDPRGSFIFARAAGAVGCCGAAPRAQQRRAAPAVAPQSCRPTAPPRQRQAPRQLPRAMQWRSRRPTSPPRHARDCLPVRRHPGQRTRLTGRAPVAAAAGAAARAELDSDCAAARAGSGADGAVSLAEGCSLAVSARACCASPDRSSRAPSAQTAEAHKDSEQRAAEQIAALQTEVAALTSQLRDAAADNEAAARLEAERDALLQAEAAQVRVFTLRVCPAGVSQHLTPRLPC